MSFLRELQEGFENADGVEAALFGIAIAIHDLAYQVKYLGNGNANTQMGAIEALGVALKDASERIASAITEAGNV